MKKISAILFSISLILLFSPTFVYYLMRSTISSTRYLLLLSIAPFLLGIIISLISKKMDTGEAT
ncbi:MAG: hypothetical protein N3D12_02655 [Candidatus Methanomethyliaceae archaeon]|nr:hypothetical protein [Candidatus Methanomethyliaceae archaeon]